MMCNVLLKKLPKDRIVETLYEEKNHLQTAGLICPDEEREALQDLLLFLCIVLLYVNMNSCIE